MSALSILDIGRLMGIQKGEHGWTGDQFEAKGLPFMGGCEICGATIVVYNSYPERTGYLRCRDCIEVGFATLGQYQRFIDPSPDPVTPEQYSELIGINVLEQPEIYHDDPRIGEALDEVRVVSVIDYGGEDWEVRTGWPVVDVVQRHILPKRKDDNEPYPDRG